MPIDDPLDAEVGEPVDAEVVEPVDAEVVQRKAAARPLRFGLKGLFLLTTLSCVTAALMSYLGPFLGAFIATLFCAIFFAVLFMGTLIWRPSGDSDAMRRLDTLAIRSLLWLLALFAIFLASGAGYVVYKTVQHARVERQHRARYGFSYTSRSIYGDSGYHNGIEITRVQEGGTFAQAGLVLGDVILLDGATNDFFDQLDDASGGSVDVTVLTMPSGYQSQSWETYPQRTVTIHVPVGED